MRTNKNEYNKGHEQEKLSMARRLRKLKDSRRKKNKQKAAARKINPLTPRAVETNTETPIEPPKDAEPLPNADTTENAAEDATEDTKFHTAKEAAEMLGVSAKQVTAFIQDKSLANAFKKSGRWQIPDSDIQTLKKKLQEPSE